MLPKRPQLPDGTVQDIQPGTVRTFRAGVYVKQDVTATFRMDGGSARFFRIVGVETDDVVVIDDPDAPGRQIQALQVADKVHGPGPIAVAQDQAVIADVEFSCPADPSQGAFDAVVSGSGISIAVRAIVNLGFLYGNVLATPPDMAPGETASFSVELFSSIGHSVPIILAYDADSDPHFATPAQSATVPAAGGTVSLRLPIKCNEGTPEGVYP